MRPGLAEAGPHPGNTLCEKWGRFVSPLLNIAAGHEFETPALGPGHPRFVACKMYSFFSSIRSILNKVMLEYYHLCRHTQFYTQETPP